MSAWPKRMVCGKWNITYDMKCSTLQRCAILSRVFRWSCPTDCYKHTFAHTHTFPDPSDTGMRRLQMTRLLWYWGSSLSIAFSNALCAMFLVSPCHHVLMHWEPSMQTTSALVYHDLIAEVHGCANAIASKTSTPLLVLNKGWHLSNAIMSLIQCVSNDAGKQCMQAS